MELLKKILNTPAASGLEDGLVQILIDSLGGGSTDENGSLIYHKKGMGKSVVFVAAMDEPSVFVTHASEDDFLRFCTNGIDARLLCGQSVEFAGGAHGVICSETDKETAADMFIDADAAVGEAQYGKIESFIHETPDRISAFDIGRAAILYAMVQAAGKITERDVYFVFLAKTIGNRHSASFLKDIPSDAELIFIDKSDANDYLGVKNVTVRAGHGVAVRAMDKSIIPSKTLYDKALGFCDCLSIQKEVSDRKNAGGTLQKSYTGYETLVVGLPVRYCGGLCEIVYKNDVDTLTDFIKYYTDKGQVL